MPPKLYAVALTINTQGHLGTNLIPFEPILAHFEASEHDNGVILGLISPLFLAQKGLNAPQIMYSGTDKKST